MDKPNQQRNTKTQKPQMKLQVKLPPNRKARRRDAKRNRRVDYQGHGYGTSNANKGAHGKCKYLKLKEKWLKLIKQLKSAKPASNVEVYGGRRMVKPSAENVLKKLK